MSIYFILLSIFFTSSAFKDADPTKNPSIDFILLNNEMLSLFTLPPYKTLISLS